MFEGGEAVVEEFVESFTLILILGPLILELLEVDGEILVLLLLQLVALLEFSVGVDEAGDLHLPVLTHALERGVLPQGVLDLDVDLVDLDLEVVDL